MRFRAELFLLALVAATPEIRYFRYERPIQSLAQSSGQNCLVLDGGIFAHAAPQLADLRLYLGETETPFVVRTSTPQQADDKSIVPLNVGVRGGQTVFDAKLPDGQYSDIQLAMKAQNFIATVTVTGSSDETGSGATKLGMFTVFDLSGQKLGRSTVLHLPESDFPFLHFSIKGPLPPESVTGISVVRVSTTQARYLTVAESSHAAPKGHSSVFEITVPANVPVDRIAFTPGASPAQFSRDVSITAEPVSESKAAVDAQSAQQVSFSGDLLRVHSLQNGHRIDEEHLAINAPWADSSSPTMWTISIENGDDAPLNLESVQLQMLQRSLCFDAETNSSYALFYGDPALSAPSYDYAKLFVPQAGASQVVAGPEQLNAVYQPRPDERPFTEKHPSLLWAALAAVIALLGLIALRSVKAVKPPPA
jgi:hypothetical protein